MHALGEHRGTSIETDFNRSVKIEFSDQRITSNADVLLLREADTRLNLTNSIAQRLIDTRNQDAIRYKLGDLIRERIYATALGYSAQDDLDRLPMTLLFESPFGIVREITLSMNDWQARQLAYVTDFRMDAGYTVGSVMNALTDQNIRFVGRLKTNAKLDELAAPYLVRSVGRPPLQGYEFCVELGMHQADSWKHPQRLILVVIDEPDRATGQLNLMPRYFFLVTNWNAFDRSSEVLLKHYCARGTFEDRLGTRLASWRLPLRWQNSHGRHRGRLRPPSRHAHLREFLRV